MREQALTQVKKALQPRGIVTQDNLVTRSVLYLLASNTALVNYHLRLGVFFAVPFPIPGLSVSNLSCQISFNLLKFAKLNLTGCASENGKMF